MIKNVKIIVSIIIFQFFTVGCNQIVTITATPDKIIAGQSAKLSWSSVIDAVNASIDYGIGKVPVNGSIIVSPSETTTYTITISDAKGRTSNASVKITVSQSKPEVNITANPQTIQVDNVVTLSWSSKYATKIVIDQNIGSVSINGTLNVSPKETTTYTITATGYGGSSSATITVRVIYPIPTVSLKASPEDIKAGESSTLSWSSTYTNSAVITGIGNVSANGSLTVSPSDTTTYTITVNGKGGTTQTSNTINVKKFIPIILEITSPKDNEMIVQSDIMVEGTIANAKGDGIAVNVNGIPAYIYNNHFIAHNVHIQNGENIIKAVAYDSEGNTGSQSIKVNFENGKSYIQILANPASGISPFETTLSLNGSFDFTQSVITYDGNGTVDFIEKEVNRYKIRITGEGIYYLTAEAINAKNVKYKNTVAIIVLNRNEQDAILKAKWDNMKSFLINNNLEEALNCFVEGSRDKYRNFFSLLKDRLPDIASKMRDIELVYLINHTAKYRIKKNEIMQGNSYEITHYIYFVKNGNGLWMIENF